MISILVISQIALFIFFYLDKLKESASKVKVLSILEEVTEENQCIRKKINKLEKQLDKLKRSFDL